MAVELFRLLRRRFASPNRTWMIMVPVHLVAFLLLYGATMRLVHREYVAATAATAESRLENAMRELQVIGSLHTGDAGRGHLFDAVLRAHIPIGLGLYGAQGFAIEGSTHLDAENRADVIGFLRSGDSQRFWREERGYRQEVQGLVRLVGTPECTPCHAVGETLAAASMRLDITSTIGTIRTHLQRNLAILILAWAALVGITTGLVKRSVRRSAARLEADLAAAESGDSGAFATVDGLVLDPISAQLHDAVRRYLGLQRQRQAEVATRLEHSDRLASVGQLAAGLAHEIKNPLAGIQGALELLREDNQDEETGKLYGEMLQELHRVNDTLHLLLASARPSPPRLANTDIQGLVAEVKRFMGPGLRRTSIEFTTEVAPDIPRANLDASKIRQVLVNLISNAAEAIEGNGKIVLRASAFPDGRGVILAVEDDGPGVSAEHQGRIFDPFFTTKFSGTGLGLAIAKSLVEQHGGTLELESKSGKGTSFYILLPVPEPTSGDPANQSLTE